MMTKLLIGRDDYSRKLPVERPDFAKRSTRRHEPALDDLTDGEWRHAHSSTTYMMPYCSVSLAKFNPSNPDHRRAIERTVGYVCNMTMRSRSQAERIRSCGPHELYEVSYPAGSLMTISYSRTCVGTDDVPYTPVDIAAMAVKLQDADSRIVTIVGTYRYRLIDNIIISIITSAYRFKDMNYECARPVQAPMLTLTEVQYICDNVNPRIDGHLVCRAFGEGYMFAVMPSGQTLESQAMMAAKRTRSVPLYTGTETVTSINHRSLAASIVMVAVSAATELGTRENRVVVKRALSLGDVLATVDLVKQLLAPLPANAYAIPTHTMCVFTVTFSTGVPCSADSENMFSTMTFETENTYRYSKYSLTNSSAYSCITTANCKFTPRPDTQSQVDSFISSIPRE